jgi:hypothetical protein
MSGALSVKCIPIGGCIHQDVATSRQYGVVRYSIQITDDVNLIPTSTLNANLNL